MRIIFEGKYKIEDVVKDMNIEEFEKVLKGKISLSQYKKKDYITLIKERYEILKILNKKNKIRKL
jgi:hypothetical protein